MRRAMYVEATGRTTIADPKVLGVGGVFRTLSAQHSELSRLLPRAEEALDSVERRDLWMDIRGEHLSHEGGEQQIVYAALQQWEKTHDLAVANAGADAVGLNFYPPSPRHVSHDVAVLCPAPFIRACLAACHPHRQVFR